ncbi:calpain family cysteine protease [Colletotrichum scovillei]|nr:calpain family cysteine protease [Colletotrichum scovillei]
MRYRDPGWDLDWDLKWEKGHCLNTLGHTKWQLSRTTLSNPSASVPKAVKRVHEIFEKPTFLKNVNGGARIGIYGFVFYRDGEWIYSIIDPRWRLW